MITLAELSALAAALNDAERNVTEQERHLSEVKEAARVLKEESIPMAMLELGVTELKLDTGEKISVKQDVYASVPAARRDEAWDWLEKHGFSGLVKTKVQVQFGKGEDEARNALLQEIESLDLQAEVIRDVHSQTLKAWLREQLEAGNKEVDLDMFGARPIWTTKIAAPKK